MTLDSLPVRALALALLLSLSASASSASADSCRGWQVEQREAGERVLGLYLSGAPDRQLDLAMFELLQKEAYLTACPLSVEFARSYLVGWRLVGRPRSDFASAVVDSLLGRAGYDVELAGLLGSSEVLAIRAPAKPQPSQRRRR